MSDLERKIIELPEICRVEGHSALTVDIENGKVIQVKLDVFEGTRFFERIVLGHKFDEIPHITSRVCAICSTGHVLAGILAVERIFCFQPDRQTTLYRELMHLGMVVESHATHICALALPDFLDTPDLIDFARKHPAEFGIWTKLRNLGASIQTLIGGRPFHPVNLHVGGMSSYPAKEKLIALKEDIGNSIDTANALCELLLSLKLPFETSYKSSYLSLIPNESQYGYFGNTVVSSDGWQADITDYKTYLCESVVAYSHAKRSTVGGKAFMVGSMARLYNFAERLSAEAASFYKRSPLARGQTHTVLNNLSQSIEIIEALHRSMAIISELLEPGQVTSWPKLQLTPKAGSATGAVECPRGTLYHYYQLDDKGQILAADMVTPSAQNSARIECDIGAVAQEYHNPEEPDVLQKHLETLVRAYDPCNTCATHMVRVNYSEAKGEADD